MDIIPTHSSNRTPLEVPYLVDKSQPYVFDNGPFAGFPERMGWDTTKELYTVNNGKPVSDPEKTPQRAAALTQAWLFFGIIYHITRVPVKTHEYISQNASGQQIVPLKPLLGVIEEWHGNISSSSNEDRTGYIRQIGRELELMGELFTRCIGLSNSVVPSEVSLSIALLFKILMLAKKYILPNSIIPREHYFGDWHDRLNRDLIENGWCKLLFLTIKKTYSEFAACVCQTRSDWSKMLEESKRKALGGGRR
jgi:hypothetical protein